MAKTHASTYAILSTKGRETFEGSAVDAIERAVASEIRLQPMGGTSVETADGESVAEVVSGASIDAPRGIVVEINGEEIDLSGMDERGAREAIRSALGQ